MRRLLLALTVLAAAAVFAGAAEAGTIPGQYIVVLKPDANAGAVANEHARAAGAEVLHVYRHALDGYAARLSPTGLLTVEADSRVRFISPDATVELAAKPPPPPPPEPPPQSLPTGVDRIDGDLSSTVSGDGAGSVNVNVAVIDSGIDVTHPDLNVVGGTDCIKKGSFDDEHDPGHGTAVAGVIGAKDDAIGVVGIAPGARLWAVRVFDKHGHTSASAIVCGVDWVTGTRSDADPANDVAVANMSLRTPGSDDGDCGRTGGKDAALHLAVCNSVAAGVFYAAGAANEGIDFQSVAPAAYDEVLTATALLDLDGKPGGVGQPGLCSGQDDSAPSFSNFATLASDQAHTLAAPGVCITTTTNDGGWLPGWGGTSFAAPHVAGVAALCISTGACAGLTPAQMIAKLRGDAEAYNLANPQYGFFGDPLRPIEGKYYGYLIRAALY